MPGYISKKCGKLTVNLDKNDQPDRLANVFFEQHIDLKEQHFEF